MAAALQWWQGRPGLDAKSCDPLTSSVKEPFVTQQWRDLLFTSSLALRLEPAGLATSRPLAITGPWPSMREGVVGGWCFAPGRPPLPGFPVRPCGRGPTAADPRPSGTRSEVRLWIGARLLWCPPPGATLKGQRNTLPPSGMKGSRLQRILMAIPVFDLVPFPLMQICPK